MVPLIDENRILLFNGLSMINNDDTRTGIKSLIYCAGLKQGNITASNIIYSIAPLINAAGRLGQAKRSVEMMIDSSEIKSFQIAQELEDENRKRRMFDQALFEEVLPIAESQIKQGKHSLVIYGEKWHSGVIGIVASRLVDRFQLPVVLLTRIEEYARGSARCTHNFDMYNALKQCKDLLTEFGGHKHAAGISLDLNNIEKFSEMFDGIVRANGNDNMLTPELQIDTELNFTELSPIFFEVVDKFAPFGLANPKPLFISKDVVSANGVKPIGFNKVKFRALQGNFAIDAICQNFNSKLNIIQSGKPFNIVYNLETYSNNGQKTLQLSIKDLQPA
jgi:single-stranded-DNA-specific exonuclease